VGTSESMSILAESSGPGNGKSEDQNQQSELNHEESEPGQKALTSTERKVRPKTCTSKCHGRGATSHGPEQCHGGVMPQERAVLEECRDCRHKDETNKGVPNRDAVV
jgi:hypothetical protein